MAFDGLVTNLITKELEEVLIGGKIDKIYQPNKYILTLGIYNSGINYALRYISNP